MDPVTGLGLIGGLVAALAAALVAIVGLLGRGGSLTGS